MVEIIVDERFESLARNEGFRKEILSARLVLVIWFSSRRDGKLGVLRQRAIKVVRHLVWKTTRVVCLATTGEET